MPREHMYDEIANDLSLWMDQTANEVALAFAPGRAPFSAKITEQQKLEYYRSKIFNPDGSPNQPGRQAEIERLGAEDFGRVYKAVVQAYPELKPPPQPAVEVPQQGPAAPAPPMMPPGPPGPPGPPMMPPGIRPMAQGGVVTEPTLALVGEAGPEAVVPLSDYQPPPYSDAAARVAGGLGAGGIGPAGAADPNATEADIVAYIQQAARQRGIDPRVALAVAQHEGTNPQTGRFDSPAQEATFPTGKSWWPYQLHYGGPDTPYAEYGTTAGMGNQFTQATGWQPGDPRAWQAATDYALDQALELGWQPWYGRVPARVGPWQGIPRRNA